MTLWPLYTLVCMCVYMCMWAPTRACICVTSPSRCNGVYIRAAYYREKMLSEEINIATDNARARTNTRVNVTPTRVCVYVCTPPPAPLPRPVVAVDVYTPNTQTRVARTIQEIFYASLLSRALPCERVGASARSRENVGARKGGRQRIRD